jgi:hypothetical protein
MYSMTKVVRPDVVQRADAGVVQRRHGASFALEAFAELRLRGLDRDDAIEARVEGAVHVAHTPRADRREDFVRTESFAWLERHLRVSVGPVRSGERQSSTRPGRDRAPPGIT